MKNIALIWILLASADLFAQNQNISNGIYFDGEPYLSINPVDSRHMVVAWMGYVPLNQITIKTKASFDGGQSWSSAIIVPHNNPLYTSADPSLEFDGNGNVFLSYVDYSAPLDSGSVFIRKSTDGGLSWNSPVEVINMHSDINKRAIDRPWITIDRSGGANDGNIYVTTMNASTMTPVVPPYNPYFIHSKDGGSTFETWQYLDTVGWLSGSLIAKPHATPAISSNGIFYAIYPSYDPNQNLFPRLIIASSANAGNDFTYQTVFVSTNTFSDSLAKKGGLLRSNPADNSHLTFIYIGVDHGDGDVFLRESFDAGFSWAAPVRVNDDPIGNNRMQDLVWADFDTDGDLVLSWRDRRNGTDSTYATSSQIWGAIKWKDSSNFSPNFKISDALINYDTVLAKNGNDFMCIKLINDTLNAVWGDTRDGKLNIWFQQMNMQGTVISARQLASEDIPCVSVYPNPAVNTISIVAINLKRVIVYDQLGKQVLMAINSKKHENIVLDLTNLSTGSYFAQIVTSAGIKTEKIIKQ